MATQSTFEMLILIPGSQAAGAVNQDCTDTLADLDQASAWARDRVTQLFNLDPTHVRVVGTATSADWLRRIVCPLGLHEERAKAMFEASMNVVKAWRSASYLRITNAIADMLEEAGPLLKLPQYEEGADIAAFGAEFMQTYQRHIAVNRCGSAEVLSLLEQLADLVSGHPSISSRFLDLECMRAVPPSLSELEVRRSAHGSTPTHMNYWLVGLSLRAAY